jgi:hypothetical protein
MKTLRRWHGLLGVAIALGAITSASAQETDAGIVAAAVRDYGYPCGDPVSVARDQAASRPDEAAWILTCKEAQYRVRFLGSERHTLIVRLR